MRSFEPSALLTAWTPSPFGLSLVAVAAGWYLRQLARARRYAYHFFFNRMIPLPFIQPKAGYPIYSLKLEALKHLLPRAIETYNAGGTLQYGKLSVSQAGIGNGKEIVPWAQIKSVQVSNGFIAIKKDGKWLNWANVAVAKTPNYFVFLALADRVVGVKS